MAAPDGMTDIHPIAPPPEVGDPWPLWAWGALAVFVVAVAGSVVLLRRRCSPPQTGAPAVPARTRALDMLHTLKRDYAEIPPADFAAGVVAALREILAERFGHASRSLTPDEFFERHRADLEQQLDAGRAAELEGLLAGGDLMRFAPGPDTPSARLPLAERAIAFVRDLPEPRPAPADGPGAEADAHPAAA